MGQGAKRSPYINVGSESIHGAVEGEGLDQQRDHDHVGEQRSEPDHVAALMEAAPDVEEKGYITVHTCLLKI